MRSQAPPDSPLNDCEFVHNPVAEVFTVSEAPDAAQRKGLLFSGALRDRKGLDLLLEAYLLEPRLNAHRLHLFGEGAHRESFEQMVRANGLNVEFHGKVPAEVLAQALRSVRLLVNPSRLEGWSASINEALCCGLPVVGWAPQVEELQGLLGLRVGLAFDARTQTAGELAETLLTALEDRGLTGLTGEELARVARSQFSAERFVQAYLAIYEELR